MMVFCLYTLFVYVFVVFCSYIAEVGGRSTGKSFRFVRACVRAVWLPIVELDLKNCWSAFSLFPLGLGWSWGII